MPAGVPHAQVAAMVGMGYSDRKARKVMGRLPARMPAHLPACLLSKGSALLCYCWRALLLNCRMQGAAVPLLLPNASTTLTAAAAAVAAALCVCRRCGCRWGMRACLT
jgi:hypothetical protein